MAYNFGRRIGPEVLNLGADAHGLAVAEGVRLHDHERRAALRLGAARFLRWARVGAQSISSPHPAP